MFPVTFDKTRAQYLLDCLLGGKPVEPADDAGWSVEDALGLAGVCLYLAISQGPLVYKQVGVDMYELPPEDREAIEETLRQDLHAAVEYYCYLTLLMCHDEYDGRFEPHVRALVSQRGELERTLKSVEGFK